MRAGTLRHRIIIQSRTETRDDYGGTTPTWAAHQACWASVEPLRGKEKVNAEAIGANMSHKVRTRYVSAVEPEMRILWGTRVLEIIDVANLMEGDKVLEMMCKEWVDS